jgi:hypothetical protein
MEIGCWLNSLSAALLSLSLLMGMCVFARGDLVADRHVKAAFDSPLPDFANLWINNDPACA